MGMQLSHVYTGKFTKITAVLLLTTVLSACDNKLTIPSLGLRTDKTENTTPAISRPLPDDRGVITYETYQVMVAKTGDTIGSMSKRVGLSAEELARHNGLRVDHPIRAGEVLALPKNVGGRVVASPSGWSPEIAATAITSAPIATGGGIGGSQPSVGRPNEPLRHRVVEGDTAYSIARLYNVSVTSLASWNGLGPDLGVRLGQEMIIPVADTTQIAATQPTTTPTPTVLPTTTTPTPTPTPVSTPPATASSGKFMAPVDGSIIRNYSPSGSNKSDGIDYSVPAGSSVRAAADGKVALVSESNGNLGTIVLIRHANGIITIYGRVSGVTVAKGDSVTRGQTIGVVAQNATPSMHFEVRKGSEVVDPNPYLN